MSLDSISSLSKKAEILSSDTLAYLLINHCFKYFSCGIFFRESCLVTATIDEITFGKTVSGNFMILNRFRVTKTKLALKFLLPFMARKLPNETSDTKIGANVHKNVLVI